MFGNIEACESCGLYYDLLVIAQLKLVSGQETERYLCESCHAQIKKYVYEKVEKEY